MTPELYFGIGMGAATICFGAGVLAQQIRAKSFSKVRFPQINGKYITDELCAAYRATEAERWEHIKTALERITAWIDKRGDL